MAYNKVLFVCEGNSCRSPMAEGLLKKMLKEKGKKLMVSSAGIAYSAAYEGGATPNAIITMKQMSIDISNHICKQLNSTIVKENDLILAMTRDIKEVILGEYPESRGKVFTLGEFADYENYDIEDPIGKESYEETASKIRMLLEKTLGKIIEPSDEVS